MRCLGLAVPRGGKAPADGTGMATHCLLMPSPGENTLPLCIGGTGKKRGQIIPFPDPPQPRREMDKLAVGMNLKA